MWILLLFISFSVFAMEQDSPNSSSDDKSTYTLTITHNKKHGSYDHDHDIAKSLLYFLGTNSPQVGNCMVPKLKQRIKESKYKDEDLYLALQSIDFEQKLSDSQELDLKLKELKKLIAESVEDALKEKDEIAAEATLQYKMKDKEYRTERFKFYAALAGLGGVVTTSAITIVTLIVANS